MNNIKQQFIKFLKGIVIGIGIITPGVSGGTAAIIVGLFEEIIESIAKIFNNFKISFRNLFPIGLGMIIGVISMAKLLKMFIDIFPLFSKFFFCGITFISVIAFAKNNLFVYWTKRMYTLHILGIFTAMAVGYLLNFQIFRETENYFAIIAMGFILSLALILPAISFSYMLYFFGIYEKTLNSIYTLDFQYLLSLILGICIGTVLFSKVLDRLIKTKRNEVYSYVFGFVLLSLVDMLF